MTEDTSTEIIKQPIIGIDNSTSGQSAGWKLWKTWLQNQKFSETREVLQQYREVCMGICNANL